MRSIFPWKIILIIIISLIISPIKSFASNISINQDGHHLTKLELQKIESKIKSTISDVSDFKNQSPTSDRIYIYGKLNKLPVVAIQFWVVSGNADYQYLIILNRKSGKISRRLKIGGRGFRDIAIYGIDESINGIKACALFYTINDPMPNPSIKGDVVFALIGENIEETLSVVGLDSLQKGCIPRP